MGILRRTTISKVRVMCSVLPKDGEVAKELMLDLIESMSVGYGKQHSLVWSCVEERGWLFVAIPEAREYIGGLVSTSYAPMAIPEKQNLLANMFQHHMPLGSLFVKAATIMVWMVLAGRYRDTQRYRAHGLIDIYMLVCVLRRV